MQPKSRKRKWKNKRKIGHQATPKSNVIIKEGRAHRLFLFPQSFEFLSLSLLFLFFDFLPFFIRSRFHGLTKSPESSTVSLIIKASEQSLNAEIYGMANDFCASFCPFWFLRSIALSLFSIADPCRPLDTLALDIDRACNGASIVHTQRSEKKKTKQKRAAIDYEMTAGNASQVIPHIGAVASFASGVVFSVLFLFGFPAHSCTAVHGRQAGRHQVKNKELNKKEARQMRACYERRYYTHTKTWSGREMSNDRQPSSADPKKRR